MLNLLLLSLLQLAIIRSDTDFFPEQISLTYDDDPQNMVFMWTLPRTSSKNSMVQIGSDKNDLSMSIVGTISNYTMLKYESPNIFTAKVTNLEVGNKIYYYRIGCDSGCSYSDVYSFKSHPGIGPSVGSSDGITQKPLYFHIVGDIGQTENSENTLQELFNQQLKFDQDKDQLYGGALIAGDLSYANGDEPLWDSFMNLKQFASTSIPMATTVGNHEWFDSKNYDFKAYLSRYYNPNVNGKRELYYSMDIGLVHWVLVSGYCQEMKSTKTQPCLADGSPQKTWLVQDLSSVDRSVTPWVFVIFHEPYYNSNTAHNMQTEGVPIQEALESTLNKYKVDLAFSGHVHAYERTCRVYNFSCVENADAPYYITIGDGGNKEGLASDWIDPQPSWSMFRQASYGYGQLTVVNNTHTQWQWYQNMDLDPNLGDEMWIVKGEKEVANEFHGRKHVTGEPIFANNERGRDAKMRNEKARNSHSRRKESD